MRSLARSILTALLCGTAVFAADVIFRTSVLDFVRPIILTPLEFSVVQTPLRLRWEGPAQMEVLLSSLDDAPRSLGIQKTPFDISRDEFPRPGGYEVFLRGEGILSWVKASRKFQIQPRDTSAVDELNETSLLDDSRTLLRAFDAARKARDKARARIRALRKDNATLNSEAARLAVRLDEIFSSEDEEENLLGQLEAQLVEAVAEIRALREHNYGLSLRLSSVNPCTAWGYFTFPRPQTIPPTRRIVRVSDNNGNIFRTDSFCDAHRRADNAALSECFCVGDTWAGS